LAAAPPSGPQAGRRPSEQMMQG